MDRQYRKWPLAAPETFKIQLLHWLDPHSTFVYFDSHGQARAEWDCLAAVGVLAALEAQAGNALEQLRHFQQEKADWLFGFLGYDLKNEVERLHSGHPDGVEFPDLFFFQPEIIIGLREGCLEIFSATLAPEQVYTDLLNTPLPAHVPEPTPLQVQKRILRAEYLQIIAHLREHIRAGDVYEMNFCQEFFCENTPIKPLEVFLRLRQFGKAPFSAFFKQGPRYALCASPERFLQKKGRLLRSQPIKGTRRRGQNAAEDEAIRRALQHSEKDRAENVMIVDLVRNDLARCCTPGSVHVPELFGIHTFETVHQMISTVEGRLRPDADAVQALQCSFPMGSMTGAPKVMAMELIEQYEKSRRGLYSGALGYFSPEADFDFNVVIRSILYRADTGYLSFHTGGAIVYDSIPEEEYDECMVKAGVILRALNAQWAE
jgi:para-aminobenzoate synthetase component I